jgi:hypothetical protein
MGHVQSPLNEIYVHMSRITTQGVLEEVSHDRVNAQVRFGRYSRVFYLCPQETGTLIFITST